LAREVIACYLLLGDSVSRGETSPVSDMWLNLLV
jgi:hypothetical protein